MCGIAGIVTWARPTWSGDVLDAMLRAMVHRGPDHQAHRYLGGADLGSCRLAIQDLSPGGHQPLLNETGTVAVVFNGEIYNAPALRDRLEAAGHRFRGRSDTEVLVHGYEEWGIGGLHDGCDGMWAFVLWDQEKRVAFLSRDRCGEKPLFYMRRGHELWFASTLTALLTGLRTAPGLHREAILEYLAWGYVAPDRCALEGIEKLPPASYLTVSADGVRSHKYWHLTYGEEQGPANLDVLEERLEELLQRAVGQCLVADVPVGAFLSGGIDSSVVVAMMARHRKLPRTFTMRVPGTERDEGEYAAAVARHLETDHVEILLGSECVDALPELVSMLGEPFSDSSVIPAYFVAREIRKHATVVLGGDGGDEGFGGYGLVPYLERLERLHRRGAAGVRWAAPQLIGWADGHRNYVARRMRAAAYASDFRFYLHNLCQIGPARMARLAGPALRDLPGDAWYRPFAAMLDGAVAPRWHHRGLLQGHIKLAGDYLVKVDTATMGHSVEARSPFLSREVVEFAARLPMSAIANETTDKILLKRLARRVVPPHCVDRLKCGFSVPYERWVEGPWRRLWRELFADSLAVREGLLSRDALDRLVRRAPEYEAGWASLVFIILMLELWLRIVAKRTDSVASLRAVIARPAREVVA
jgi:asparagine synthase (glutamine-hydrolysing)